MEPNTAGGSSLTNALASGQALNGSAGGLCRLAGGACDAGLSCSAMTVRRPPRRRGLAGWRSFQGWADACLQAGARELPAALVHDSACPRGQADGRTTRTRPARSDRQRVMRCCCQHMGRVNLT